MTFETKKKTAEKKLSYNLGEYMGSRLGENKWLDSSKLLHSIHNEHMKIYLLNNYPILILKLEVLAIK